MAATYDPKLPTARDNVRFLIGDTVPASARFSDEEIDALVTQQADYLTAAQPYLAACAALRSMRARAVSSVASSTGNIRSKSVGRLSISYGADSMSISTIDALIAEYTSRAASISDPSMFKAYPDPDDY